ncbi:hypothetical protein HPG46_27735 (plasmid) [Bacillus cereus]|nr:hypothetical protein HPG46_27735 [Bacillus cereus]
MLRFFIQTMLKVGEIARDLIAEGTAEGRDVARQYPDYREERPQKYIKKQMEHAISLLDDSPYKQVVTMTGISKTTLIREVRCRKVQTK